MPKKLLSESASTLTKSGNRWRAVLAVPGQGTSGFYSEAMLREYGPAALAPGAKAFINHDPKRDPRDMFGTYPDGAVYEDGVGLVGELEVFPHYKELIETVGTHAALSIYMVGEIDEGGNVTALVPDRQNGVDLVSYGGLEGSGIVEKLYESALAHSTKRTVEASAGEKEGQMDEKILEALTALTESLKPVIAFVNESKEAGDKSAQAQVDAEAVESAVSEALSTYDEKVVAIEAAGLLEPQVEELRAQARAGKDITKSIESAKKVVEAAQKRVTESTYVVNGSAADEDWSVNL